MSNLKDHEAIDAFNIVNSVSAQKAHSELKEAVWKMWIDAEDVEAREKLHGLALGSEMFWRIMHKYATHGKKMVEGLDEIFEESRRAID